MTASPRVSVIIPTYNRLRLLDEALASVSAQTYQDFEILIVDDGSQEPVFDWADGREKVRCIRHTSNLGAAAARNTGVRQAQGELVAFLDSDDTWLPEKLAEQVAFMDSDSALAACTTGYFYDTEEGWSVETPPRHKNWLKHLLMGCALGPGTTLMARRQVFETVGYLDETMVRHEDWEWLLRLTEKFSLDVIQEPLARVNRAGQPPAWMVEAADLAILAKHVDLFERFGRFYGTRAIGKRYLEIAVHYFAEGNRPKGRAYLFKTLRANPIQRPGMYLRVLDGLLGTSLLLTLKRLKKRLE